MTKRPGPEKLRRNRWHGRPARDSLAFGQSFVPLAEADYTGCYGQTKTPCRRKRGVPLGKRGTNETPIPRRSNSGGLRLPGGFRSQDKKPNA